MEPIHIGFILPFVAKGAVFLKKGGNLMFQTIHCGIEEAEPDEERSRPFFAKQFLENPLLF